MSFTTAGNAITKTMGLPTSNHSTAIMQHLSSRLVRTICTLLVICTAYSASAQNLKLTDFAIWGGGASPNPYNSAQGVFINNTANIQGNIGSNHLVSIVNNFKLTGNIYSGNNVVIKNGATITGNIFANRMGTAVSPTISGGTNFVLAGNLTANGKTTLSSGSVTGTVAVPTPTNTNYTGPLPSGNVIAASVFPTMPSMPNNTPFDNQVGTVILTTTQTISPGVFRKLALTGSKTLTFNGPGNYIFYEIDNGTTTNNLIFDFNNSSTGTINIFIIKDARWGLLSVKTVNGNFPSRIYTEVHGNGSTFGGNSFDLKGPNSIPAGSSVWLGNVWAPNGGISIDNTVPSTTPHIMGALWSGKLVTVKNDLRLVYVAPAADPSYVNPYYAPPASGKVVETNNVIGAELTSLNLSPLPITSITKNEIFILDNAGKVMIEVISKNPNDVTLKGQLISLGMTDTVNNGPHTFIISGFFPISNLPQLNTNPLIQYVRPLFPAISNGGQVTTQGDSTMRSYNVRSRFGLDGSGVKIGVISDSYNSKLAAQNDVDQGDLPGIRSNNQANENPEPVQVVMDLPQRGNDEGRAMLQIVHDIAPKSKLAFRTGFLTEGDFAKAIQELASPNLPGGRCDVIVDDITYITEPFLTDGVVAQTIDQAVAQGVTYFSAAGNFGNKSYESVFNGVTNASVIPTGQIHKFGANASDIYQTLHLKPGSYTIVLQWDDEFHSLGSVNGVQTDMDLYLIGANGYTLFGFNRSNLFGDPYEVCPFTVTDETNVKLMVVRAAGLVNVRFKYIIFRGEATIMDYPTGTSTIVGHPNANGTIAVGAMLYANIPSVTPVWPGVASFSSRGGTIITQSNALITRNKPDIVAPNGVNTTVNLGNPAFNDGDAYPNFFGTSAAAPHVAAVGALLIQGRKKFNLQTVVTPAEIKQQLITSAGKFSYLPGNFSFEGGYGYTQADSAIAQIANARPMISSLETVIPGAQNGALSFEVKIKGKYLTENTKIYFKGLPVPTIVSADKTEARATVKAIPVGQDPPLQLYNPPKSPSQTDGGLSEAVHFFSSIIDITIRAQNKTRKYGQANPAFTIDVYYNGLLMTDPDTLTKLKLDGNNLSYTTIATAASNAGLYGIFPSRAAPLANTDPLLSRYGFTFISGTLSVGKMPLKITPQNKTLVYGDDLGEINYTYELEPSNQNAATLADEVRALHKKYLTGNGIIVLKKTDPHQPIPLSNFSNMSTMASFQSVRNARKYVLENGQLKVLQNTIDPLLIDNQRFYVDASTQSLVNYNLDSANAPLVQAGLGGNARGFLNIKALTNGNAKASIGNGQLQAMVNGQLLAMVNQQTLPIANGQLQAMVNGQLQAMVNGQLVAMVNGQLMALVNGQLEAVQGLSLSNGQLEALVNGQLEALVNGQLKAMVNGVITDIANSDISLVNGQLQAMVNGQLEALVNGQLQAMVNGQLQPLVNGAGVAVTSVRQLANGQLQALVNGTYIPISNGQLEAIVNGQLLAMVNGQLMAMVNGEVTFAVFSNGQLEAMVNGQLEALVNGQLLAMVNGQLQTVNSYSIVNGQLEALVNGQTWAYANGQLLAMVNGQLQALVNNFDVSGPTNNAKTLVLVDQNDLTLQSGSIGAMFSMNMITGLDVGTQLLIPGAFVNENFEVTYGTGQIEILQSSLSSKANDASRVYGDANPDFTISYTGLKYDDDAGDITTPPVANTTADVNSYVGTYPISITGGSSANYTFDSYAQGILTVTKKNLTVTADNKSKLAGDENPPLTITYTGLAGNDTKDSVCAVSAIAPSPKEVYQLNRITTYTNVKLNNGTNIINATPGQSLTLTGNYSSVYYDPTNYCPGCITQIYIGMSNAPGSGIAFTDCYNVSGLGSYSGPINKTFTAPTTPGVYYITQVSSWEYNCYDNGSGNPGNNPNDAIAVVNVNYAPAVPSSPIDVHQLNRITTYTNVRLNGGTNVITATPGQSVTLTGNYNSAYYDPTNYCPGCITQIYIGMANPSGTGAVFTDCYNVSGQVSYQGSFNKTFTAPTTPGIYYITQVSSWEYNCYDNGSGMPGNDPGNAIAVVVVNFPSPNTTGGFTASTTATASSLAGTYPITLQGCSTSPNYTITLQNGSLLVTDNFLAGGRENPFMEAPADKVSEDRLYPNPGSAMVTLQLKDEVQGTEDIRVYDFVGRPTSVSLKKINEKMFEINVSALPKGVYFIKVKTPNVLKTFKFIRL
jgi:hypothetical protein